MVGFGGPITWTTVFLGRRTIDDHCGFLEGERAQYYLINEYSSNYRRTLYMIFGIFSN